MANDLNQTIQDSRRAADAFLDAAKRRKKEVPSPQERTRDFNERFNEREYQRVKQAGGEALDQYWKEEKDRQDRENERRSGAKAANNFLRAGRVNEARRYRDADGESPSDLASRIRNMSDEEFDAAVKSGMLTPEQIRKAGEYEWDIYMGDVWIENPENDNVPEPTYDEFMSDPAKYGYTEYPENPSHFDRYNPNRYKKQ